MTIQDSSGSPPARVRAAQGVPLLALASSLVARSIVARTAKTSSRTLGRENLAGSVGATWADSHPAYDRRTSAPRARHRRDGGRVLTSPNGFGPFSYQATSPFLGVVDLYDLDCPVAKKDEPDVLVYFVDRRMPGAIEAPATSTTS